ncbi:MAG TPA: GNAT family N-acetyltransferase [Polyangia bacterium]
MEDLRIEHADITAEGSRALIDALDIELSARYPEERVNVYSVEAWEVSSERGCFLSAIRGSNPVGCCALRRLTDGTGEIKRMFVTPAERGQGVGKRLLLAIQREAHSLGIRRLVLETGVRQPEAIGLYERFGFVRIPAFGEYVENPLSLCMGKEIAVESDELPNRELPTDDRLGRFAPSAARR